MLIGKGVFRPWRRGSGDSAVFAGFRMAKVDRKRMKALAMVRAKPCFGAVKGVPDNRVTRHGEVRAYLVRHTRENRHLEQRGRSGGVVSASIGLARGPALDASIMRQYDKLGSCASSQETLPGTDTRPSTSAR